jgi:hypothetical protein
LELLGRRWDRWDGIVAAAAVTLIVVSFQPWFAIGTFLSVNTRTARDASRWSQAVVLGTLAAGIHLANRGRAEARGAAWLALVLLVGGLGLTGWQWHQALNTKPGEGIIYVKREEPGFIPNPFRSDPQWGLYAGTGSLILMFAAIGRGLVGSQPRTASAD